MHQFFDSRIVIISVGLGFIILLCVCFYRCIYRNRSVRQRRVYATTIMPVSIVNPMRTEKIARII